MMDEKEQIERVKQLAGEFCGYAVMSITPKEDGGFSVRYSDGASRDIYLRPIQYSYQ